MKKIFTLIGAIMAFAGASYAASVDDLVELKHSYVLVCDEWNNNGTEKIAKNTLFGDDHFFTPTGNDVGWKDGNHTKGSVDLSQVDALGEDGTPLYVTQDIVDKYAEYGLHYNSMRLKNAQDVIALKLTAKSKLIIFLQGNNKTGKDARIPKIAKSADLSDALNSAPDADHPATVSGFKWEYTVDDDGLYYIGSYNGDMFVSYIIVEAFEAEGTPAVKVGPQTYEGGLYFKEVTCTPRDAYGISTDVYYTTDGTEPTADSQKYTEPIKCYAPATLKFQAFVMGSPVPGADNEANVNFIFDAPSISAEGADVTITSPYEGAKNFYSLNGAEAQEGSNVTLTESATVTAYSKIVNGSYATFTTNSTSKDVYVLDPIKQKKIIAVTAGEAVLDEEATATSTTGEVYKVEGGEISAEKADFFVKNLTFKAEKNADYQVPAGQEVYIQMSNTSITFFVAEGDSVDVKVVCTKNSCKNIDADDAEDGSQVNDRKCYVNVSGTNYCLKDEEGNETNDLKLYPNANEFSFGLKGAEGGSYFTFQKYSGTGNIMISSIEITPAAAEPAETETVLWEGNALVNGWADQPFFLSDGGKELTDNNAKAGDRIRIYASAPDNTWQVELFNGHWDGMVERFSAVALTEEDGSPRESSIFDLDALGYFEYTITDTFLTTNTVAQGWGGTFLLNGDGNLTVTKVTLVQGGASGIETIKAVNVKNGAVYNLSGQKVDASYKGVVIKNGKKMLQK